MAARSSAGKAKRGAAPKGGVTPKGGAPAAETHGKRVVFDAETWNALDLLARDSMKDFQELADEAFRDLLRKHGRPTDLKSALKRSVAEATSGQATPARRRTAT